MCGFNHGSHTPLGQIMIGMLPVMFIIQKLRTKRFLRKVLLSINVCIVLTFFKQDLVHILAMNPLYLQNFSLQLIRLDPTDNGLGSKLVTFIWNQSGFLICFLILGKV